MPNQQLISQRKEAEKNVKEQKAIVKAANEQRTQRKKSLDSLHSAIQKRHADFKASRVDKPIITAAEPEKLKAQHDGLLEAGVAMAIQQKARQESTRKNLDKLTKAQNSARSRVMNAPGRQEYLQS